MKFFNQFMKLKTVQKFRKEENFLSVVITTGPWWRPLKAPPANFSVLKCNFWYYPQKTEICNTGPLHWGCKKMNLTEP